MIYVSNHISRLSTDHCENYTIRWYYNFVQSVKKLSIPETDLINLFLTHLILRNLIVQSK